MAKAAEIPRELERAGALVLAFANTGAPVTTAAASPGLCCNQRVGRCPIQRVDKSSSVGRTSI